MAGTAKIRKYHLITAESKTTRNMEILLVIIAILGLANLFFSIIYTEKNQKCCQYCKSESNLSVDHILALINGGKNNISNMQILCRSCNSKKGSKLNYIHNE